MLSGESPISAQNFIHHVVLIQSKGEIFQSVCEDNAVPNRAKSFCSYLIPSGKETFSRQKQIDIRALFPFQ